MSKYSFIDAELNIPGKQCFCVDINNSNTQFTYANANAPAPVPIPTNTPSPIPTNTSIPIPMNTTNLDSNKIDNHSSINNSFLLSPDVKYNIGEREKEIIKTVNSLLTNTTLNNLDNKSSIAASNEIISNIPNNSLTVDNKSNVDSTIDLNKMATSKKNYKSKSNIDLFEKFEQNKCNHTCSIKNKYKKHRKYRKHAKHTKKGKSFLDNDNIIIIIIILLLAYSYFQNKK